MNARTSIDRSDVVRHVILGIVVSTLMSGLFYLIWGVFVLSGFILWSIAAGVTGAGVSLMWNRKAVTTIAATIVIRLAVFFLMTGALS